MRLFIIALESEISKTIYNVSKFKIINNIKYYILDKHNILVFSDVGTINAAYVLSCAISNFKKINSVINIGTCGAVNKSLAANYLILPKKVLFLDVDYTKFGYQTNQVPRQDKYFLTNELNNEKIQLYLEIQDLYIGNIGTSNTFIDIENYNKFNDIDSCLGVDMEAASLAMICKINNIDFNCLKVVSDSIFYPANSEEQFKNNLENCRNTLNKILKFMIDKI